MKLKVIILLISLLSGSIEAQTIHYNAFSHNDYERPRPLFDALSFQFNCVEADLWLIDGELYVSHDSVAPYLSGKSPRKAIAAETNRFIFLDGTIEDLGKGIPAVLMPVISDNYSKYIGWKGQGEIPAEKLEKVREYIRQTHAEGKLFRWWGAPDTPLFKKLFIKEGVDLIGADDLKALSLILQNLFSSRIILF